jgi:hypothetical protein
MLQNRYDWLQNRYIIGGGIVAVLLLANIISYLCSGWGLITVTVKDAPLGQVIKSIERQGWVTIYTDMPLDTKVSMYVEKVPLAEAMETLTANLGGTDAEGKRVPSAEWKLGFFAAPTSAAVKQEIRNFQAGSLGDDTKIYSYATPLQMLASGNSDADSDLPAADPRLQSWPGYHPPPTPPAPAANAVGPDGQAQDAPAPPPPPSTVQDYLHAFAEEADILIMAPDAWAPNVPAPAPNSSIIHAVKNLVGRAHGSVELAIVLRSRERRPGGGGGQRGGGAGGDTGWAYMEDRMSNAIQGLPEDARPGATAQLAQEVKFQKDVQAAAPDQRMAMMRQHFMNRMGQNNWRRSPEKRAQMYARAVANRQSARGQ